MIRIVSELQVSQLLGRTNDQMNQAIAIVEPIIQEVRLRGDDALRDFRNQFDLIAQSEPLFVQSCGDLEPNLLLAVEQAAKNIRRFAEAQIVKPWMNSFSADHEVGQIVRPLNSVGVYVPAGRFPLISTMLMAVIPAQVAGVREITIACPKPSAEILSVAKWLGIERVLQIGGAQAVAALAYGTESVSPVQRIVGPGNIYVAAAKKLVSLDVAIDFVAGPSEIVIVSSNGKPEWIAGDMLAQAEHDENARALLLTTSETLAKKVQNEIEKQLSNLPTAQIARCSVDNNSAIILCRSNESAFDLVNQIAPEHLSIESFADVELVQNAGSIFVGEHSTEAAGDYASGPNHILPTAGLAMVRGGLSVNDFVKVITVQELSKTALGDLSFAITQMARAEGLEAHARSVEMRTNATA